MKINILNVAILFTLILTSCNTEEDFSVPNVQQIRDFELVNLNDFVETNSTISLRAAAVQNQIVIRFKDEAAYEKAAEELQSMSKEEQLTWATALEGFNSLREIYEQAMIDVDYVDETEASYMAFKKKYDQYLYFPMHKEDMGFYMPVIEQENTSLANADGLVIIGNEVKNMKNITSYADLQKTGQSYYSSEENVTTRANIPVGYNTKSDFIGKEIDSGWFEDVDKDRKLRFKFGRKSNKGTINPIPPNMSNPYGTPGLTYRMNLKLEISFRKKTWLGWVNYSSETNTNMVITIGTQKFPYPFKKSGSSSHDWTDANALPWGNTGQYLGSIRPIFITPAISATFNTDFRGFDGANGTSIINWSCTLPDEYFTEY